jgi:hypothetical protein
MVIRRRSAVSNPVAFNEDKAIRIALRHGATALRKERETANEFPDEYTEAQHMELDRQIAYLERMQKHDGLLTLASK